MPEAGPAELLGGDDHRQVLAVAALAVAAVLGRHATARRRRSRRGPSMTSSGTSPFVRWTCSACGATTLSANDRNVSWTSSMSASRWRGPGRLGERGEELRVAVGGRGTGGRARSGAGSTPHSVLPPGEAGDQVVDHVGGEGAGDAGLGVALGAVVEQRPRRGRGGRGVGEVVGEDLLGVGAAGVVEVAHGGGDHVVGEVDDLGGGRQVGGGGERYAMVTADVTDRYARWLRNRPPVSYRCARCRVRGRCVLRIQRRVGSPAFLEQAAAARLGDRPTAASGWCTAAATSG